MIAQWQCDLIGHQLTRVRILEGALAFGER